MFLQRVVIAGEDGVLAGGDQLAGVGLAARDVRLFDVVQA
jgi:hypothetical protein